MPDWYVEIRDSLPSLEDREDAEDYGYAEAAALLHPIAHSITGVYSEQEKLKAILIIDLWEYPEFDEYVEAALTKIDKYLEESQ